MDSALEAAPNLAAPAAPRAPGCLWRAGRALVFLQDSGLLPRSLAAAFLVDWDIHGFPSYASFWVMPISVLLLPRGTCRVREEASQS